MKQRDKRHCDQLKENDQRIQTDKRLRDQMKTNEQQMNQTDKRPADNKFFDQITASDSALKQTDNCDYKDLVIKKNQTYRTYR